jgi:hypothetical protein
LAHSLPKKGNKSEMFALHNYYYAVGISQFSDTTL